MIRSTCSVCGGGFLLVKGADGVVTCGACLRATAAPEPPAGSIFSGYRYEPTPATRRTAARWALEHGLPEEMS